MLSTTKPFLLPHRLSNIKTQFNQCYSHISQKNPSIKLSIHIISPISKKHSIRFIIELKFILYFFLNFYWIFHYWSIGNLNYLGTSPLLVIWFAMFCFFFFFKLLGSSLVVIFSVASEKQAVNIIKVQISYFLLCLYCILSKIYLLLQMS